MQKLFKRVTAGILTAAMTTFFIPPAMAEYTGKGIPLDASRIDADKLPEGNLIYMGTAAATVAEEDAVYEFPVYREGDLSERAAVTVHTIDMTAVYGKDYEIVGEDVTRSGDKSSLLKLAMTTEPDEDGVEDEDIEPDADIESEIDEMQSEKSDGVSLRALKEEQTGEDTREPYEDIADLSLSQSLADELVPEVMQSLRYSSEFTVEFEPGEDEKIIRFRILDDNESEGVEGFSLMLVYPENAELYEVTSLSVSIEDDEPVEHSSITFSKKSYKSNDGKVHVKILRKGAEYSLCNLMLMSVDKTAVRGENYNEIMEEIVFLPYETEKNIDIPVSGEGTFKLLLREFDACEEGKYTEAVVKINENRDIKLMSGDTISPMAGSGSKPMPDSADVEVMLNINGLDCILCYNLPEGWPEKHPAMGYIYADGYDVPPEVGRYYFPADEDHEGYFKYGHTYGDDPHAGVDWGDNNSNYAVADVQEDMSQNYGNLQWYCSYTAKTGGVSTTTDNIFEPVYFQYAVPHWASTTNFGVDGQNAYFCIGDKRTDVSGTFHNDTLPPEEMTHGVITIKDEYKPTNFTVGSEDNDIYTTPKSYVRLYGIAAMYKRYDVRLYNPDKLTYKVGMNETEELLPFEAHITSGAEIGSGYEARSFYANLDEADQNMAMTLEGGIIQSRQGYYGQLTGYKILINPGNVNDKITLEYPREFLDYVEELPGMDDDTFNAERKKVEDNLLAITTDEYFIRWINEKQAKTASGNGTDQSGGYHQNLDITPQVEYIPAKVTIEKPSIAGGTGSFNDERLKIAEGEAGRVNTADFYAGDFIDLSSTPDDPEHYHAVGYMVKKDNSEEWDIITSTQMLFLEPNVEYTIRPCITAIKNRIEIVYDNGAEKYLDVQNILPQDELNRLIELSPGQDADENKTLAGRYFLDMDPTQEYSLIPRINPEVGALYTLNITSVEDENYIYRPVIKHNIGTYTTNAYHMIAGQLPEDNVVHIGYKRIAKNDLTTFNVTGTLMSKVPHIRENPLALATFPVEGYTINAGAGTQSPNKSDTAAKPEYPRPDYLIDGATTTTMSDGTFTLKGIKGQPGDVITLSAVNGAAGGSEVMNNVSHGEVVTVTLNDRGGVDRDTGNFVVKARELTILYPSDAPEFRDVQYSYSNAADDEQLTHSDTSIPMKGSDLNLSFTVNPNGHDILRVIVTTVSENGVMTDYEGEEATINGQQIFTVTIEGVLENAHSGDRIYARIVDGDGIEVESDEYDDNGKLTGNKIINTVYTEYPKVDTGLMLTTQSNKTLPVTFDYTQAVTADVPLIGSATGVAQSGKLKLNRTYWDDDKTGYTIQVNVDAIYNQAANPSTPQKAERYQAFHKAGTTAKTKNLTAESMFAMMEEGETEPNEDYIANSGGESSDSDDDLIETEPDNPEDSDQDIPGPSVQEQIDTEKQITATAAKYKKESKNPYAGFNTKTLSVEPAVVLAFDFAKSQTTNEYIFVHGTVAIGGTVTYNKTKYGSISNVPVFFNLVLTLQANVVATYSTGAGRNALSAGEFEDYQGNLANLLSEDYEIGIDVMLTGKIQAGVGICGVLSARGYLSLTIQFNIQCADLMAGVLFTATGGVGVDLLFISVDVDIASVTLGFGSMANKSSFSFFGGLAGSGKLTLSAPPGIQVMNAAEGDDKIIAVDNTQVIKEHTYSNGSADMSAFGIGSDISPMSVPRAARVHTLLENAAERTRPHIIPLDGGRKFVTFIGNNADNGRDSANSATLYYSVYDGGRWLAPVPVADDGTMDSDPVIKEADGKIYIAWADADGQVGAEDNAADKLNRFGISMAVYDIGSGVMSEEISLTEDGFLNMAPQIDVDGKDVYVSYMKRDLADMRDDTDLINIGYLYSTMAYVKYDADSGETSDEIFISIPHETLTDPLVTDYQSEIYEMGDSYMISAYTVDEDENLSTEDDRELYLGITNLDSGKSCFPIRITDNNVCESTPRLAEFDGKLYLTWLEDGYIFNITAISDILVPMLDTPDSDIFDSQKVREAYSPDNCTEDGWWKKTAAQLGMDEDAYDSIIYKHIADGDFKTAKTNFSGNEAIRTGIGSYALASDGSDIYVYYTAFGKDISSTGLEIYGAKFKDDNTFTKSVQLTEFGKVIDELDLYMTSDGYMSAVSNYYDQYADAEGIHYGENKLVGIEFEPASSVKIANGITFPSKLVPGTRSKLEFDAENAGLIDAQGYRIKVSEVKDGRENVIFDEDFADTLKVGETAHINIPWTIPSDTENMSIKAEITENGAVDTITTVKKIPRKKEIKIFGLETTRDGNDYTATARVTNTGNIPSEPTVAELVANDSNYNKIRSYGTAEVPSLNPGEETEVTIKFRPSVSDFDLNQYINLSISIEDGGHSFDRIISLKPLIAEINGGEESITMSVGDTAPIETKAAPWNVVASDVQYYSSDNNVAVVNVDNEIVAVSEGTATIYAYYTNCDASDTIEINVTGVSDGSVIADAQTNTISVTYDEDCSATIIIAGYDSDTNALTNLHVIPVHLTAEEPAVINASDYGINLAAGDRIMVWNSLDDMTPLVKAGSVR